MKKLLVTLLLGSSLCSFSQVRHVKGVHFIDVNYQQTFEGNGFQIGYGYFFAKNLFFSANFSKEAGNIGLTDFTLLGAKIQTYFTVANPLNKYYITPYVSAFIGEEQLSCIPLDQNINHTMYSVGVGLLQEYYFTSLTAVNVFAQQDFYSNSKLGENFFTYGIGVKLIINNIRKVKFGN